MNRISLKSAKTILLLIDLRKYSVIQIQKSHIDIKTVLKNTPKGLQSMSTNLSKYSFKKVRNSVSKIKNSSAHSEDYDLTASGCDTASATLMKQSQYRDNTVFKASAYNIKASSRKQQNVSQKNDPLESIVSILVANW